MLQKSRAVTFKVITGYLLLIIIAAGAVYFVYGEIVRLSNPQQTGKDNERILEASDAIASLYASEAIAREYMLSGAPADRNRYQKASDSVYRQINALKKTAEPKLVIKLDSIQLLLRRKEASINNIVAYRSSAAWENTFRKAASQVHNVKDSIREKAPPVRASRKNQYNKLLEAFLSRRQLDSLSKLPVSNDSLTMAFGQAFNRLIEKDNRVRERLYQQEQKMLEENRIISDQLRAILSSMEQEFLQNTYRQLQKNQESVSRTFNTIARIGAGGIVLILVLTWVIIRDLSNNQKYRKRLEELNIENENLLKTKSILMATVTHDLKTPLGSILGFKNLLQTSGLSSKQNQYLNNIEQSADYILRLVNDLLDFSKLENNRLSINKKPADIRDLIETTCRNLRPLAENKDIELTWDIEDTVGKGIETDAYRLRQVLINIISNAIKFTHEGTVEVTAKCQEKSLMISILDTGIGIARDKQDDVFREFTQASQNIEKTYGGTGLGLTISKKIVEMLGGTIHLESEEGKGSIFTIVLPAEEVLAPAITEMQAKTSANNKIRAKVLVVDDDAMQLTLMREVLTQNGLQVTTEANPNNALRLLDDHDFDIMLSDVQMPLMDGFMLVNKVRKHNRLKVRQLPVIALSGGKDMDIKYYTNMGFTACLSKPARPDALIQAIASLLPENIVAEGADVPVKEYNLTSLLQFTQNDKESLRTIVNTFIASADENCAQLRSAVFDDNTGNISATAHKMIPMLRQMEVHEIVSLLEPLEENPDVLTAGERRQRVDAICSRMKLLCSALQQEVA